MPIYRIDARAHSHSEQFLVFALGTDQTTPYRPNDRYSVLVFSPRIMDYLFSKYLTNVYEKRTQS